MELRRLFIKDADLLKELPLPRRFTARKKERQDFLRLPGQRVYLLEGKGGRALICGRGNAVDPAYLSCRLYAGQMKADFSPAACAALLLGVETDAFSMELLLPPELPGAEAGEPVVLEDPRNFPCICRRFFFERPVLFPRLSLIKGPRFGLVLEVNPERDKITGLRFLRDGQAVAEREDARLLAWLGCLDERGQFSQSACGRQDPRKAAFSPLQIRAEEELSDYLRGRRHDFDLPLDFSGGTDFQRKVWAAMAEIPYGNAISYEELAARAFAGEERPRRYARAVGMACGANPICILLPCHRVIGSGGDLVGFSGGVDVKASLLDLELFNYRGRAQV